MVNVPLIPREVLFGNPTKVSPRISPDGTQLAYIAPDEGVLNVWLKTVGKDDDRPITQDRKRGIRVLFWAFDSRHILYIQDKDGDENWHIFAIDPDTDSVRDLTPLENIQAQTYGADPAFPDEIIIGLNDRDERFHDAYRLNIATGERKLLAENPGTVANWLTDAKLEVRGAWSPIANGGFELLVRDSADSDWRTLRVWGPEDNLTCGPIGFTKDGKSLFLQDSSGTNTSELRLLNAATGELKTLASNPEVDLESVLFHPVERRAQAAAFDKDRVEWTVLDPDIAEDFKVLQTAKPGQFHIASRDLADETWIVYYDQDTAPPAYYTYDRKTKKLELLFTTRPELENYTLAEVRPLTITSRDGLTLHCYLTLPPGEEPKNLPMVLDVHGGPWYRDAWGYEGQSQWMANRGYAHLRVNFRGSTGYGKAFVNAANREWGGKMHDDLIDAVNWAIKEGIADPKRIAIYGGSYGGYAALCGAAFTPDVFACSIDVVGVSNLKTFLSSIPPYWEVMRKMLNERVGNLETDGDFLDSRSPLFKADQIKCPMLIAQGANDPRVKQAESEQIVESLRKRGKPVEYLLFEDEGHGFARPENNLKFYAAAEKFLAEHIGGRYME